MKKKTNISTLLLNNVTKHLPQYVFWKDIHSVYLGCNDNYASLHNFTSPEDIVGKSDDDLNWQSQGYTADIFRQDDRRVIQGESMLNKEEPLCLPNGDTIITLVSKRPMVDDNNITIGIVGYFVDITETRNAEKREFDMKIQNQRKDLLEHISRHDSVKEAVLAVAHEVNQPLSAVVNYASGCQKRLLNKYGSGLPREIQIGLNQCVEQARRAGQIIHTLKDMLCYKTNNLEWTSINTLINNTIALLADKIKPTQVELQLKLDVNIQKIRCDRIQIELVVTNLIKNAYEAISECDSNVEKIITVSTKPLGENNVQISIENTGGVIKPKILENIFFPFVSTKEEGIGLGLSLSKSIIEQHNGQIHVHLTKVPSVVFEVTLPCS